MTRLSLAFALALSGSLLLHGAGLLALPAPGEDQLAGGEGQLPQLLGDSFADMAQGMAEAVTPAQPLVPAPAAALAPLAAVTPVSAPVTPDGMAPLAPPQDIAALPPGTLAPARSVTKAPVAARTRSDPVAAKPPQPARAAEPKLQPRPPKPSATSLVARSPSAKGAETAARKGIATGRPEGSSNRTGARQKAAGDGGKAAQASHGRSVMRKIASTRKKPTALRGTAVIAFSIAANGQLASARVARSSGSAELDALALDHIRRAAPFAAPPSGTIARYSVEFLGR